MIRTLVGKRTYRLLALALSIVLLLVSAAAYGFPGSGDTAQSSHGHHAAMAADEGLPPAPENLPELAQPVVAPPVGDRGPQLVKYELEVQEVVARLDDGVAYHFWTFDGTVPGPMLRVRQGDTVEITLKNPADSGVTHSIDLHAVMGPGGGAAVTQVMPGDEATFRFLAQHPGLYVYHCATPPVPTHIALGMYGMILVEPEGGLPPVDREFYVMQGDVYVSGERGEKGLHDIDMQKMLDEKADYVVFNGSVDALNGENALQAKTGETVRIFFGVGGPNLVSSFHVIGQVFDRVQPEGASEWVTNVQTTLVPAGGATIVEFTPTVPGDYTLVDHSIGRTMKGATGTLHVEGPDNPDVFQVIEPGSGGTGGH